MGVPPSPCSASIAEASREKWTNSWLTCLSINLTLCACRMYGCPSPSTVCMVSPTKLSLVRFSLEGDLSFWSTCPAVAPKRFTLGSRTTPWGCVFRRVQKQALLWWTCIYPLCVCLRVASFLLSLGAHLEFLPRGGGWLSRMLKPSGIWSFLHCPYADRSPTNIVHMRLRGGSRVVPRKRTDWLLVSSPPPPHCFRYQLPGLSTHLAQLVCMVFDHAQITPQDPVGRMFDLKSIAPERKGLLAVQ